MKPGVLPDPWRPGQRLSAVIARARLPGPFRSCRRSAKERGERGCGGEQKAGAQEEDRPKPGCPDEVSSPEGGGGKPEGACHVGGAGHERAVLGGNDVQDEDLHGRLVQGVGRSHSRPADGGRRPALHEGQGQHGDPHGNKPGKGGAARPPPAGHKGHQGRADDGSDGGNADEEADGGGGEPQGGVEVDVEEREHPAVAVFPQKSHNNDHGDQRHGETGGGVRLLFRNTFAGFPEETRAGPGPGPETPRQPRAPTRRGWTRTGWTALSVRRTGSGSSPPHRLPRNVVREIIVPLKANAYVLALGSTAPMSAGLELTMKSAPPIALMTREATRAAMRRCGARMNIAAGAIAQPDKGQNAAQDQGAPASRHHPKRARGNAEQRHEEVEQEVEVPDNHRPVPEAQHEKVCEQIRDAPVREAQQAGSDEEKVCVAVKCADRAQPARVVP